MLDRVDWRGWIARKLLGLVNKIDPDCKGVFDQRAKWAFRRNWKPEVHGGKHVR